MMPFSSQEPALSSLYLGSADPTLILYLPTPPIRLASGAPISIPELITLNGNHWRKIFSLLAKLSAPHEDWRGYRDQELLHHREAISFGDSLLPLRAKHLVAGKASWARLGLDPGGFQPVDAQQRLWQQGELFLTPYLDYRQFPNTLVEQLKPFLRSGPLRG